MTRSIETGTPNLTAEVVGDLQATAHQAAVLGRHDGPRAQRVVERADGLVRRIHPKSKRRKR